MIGRTLLVCGVYALLGVGIFLRPAAKPQRVDEAWLEKTYPSSIGRYTMLTGPESSGGHTYKMDKPTYQALKPYGIVARVLSDGKSQYDVVVIAGDEPDTFHNPVACFGSQEWKVTDSHPVKLQTKSRGIVNATLTKAEKGGEVFSALYTFEGPDGTFDNNSVLHKDLFVSQLRTGKVQPATFFRFMSRTSDEAEISNFAVQYLDSAPVRPIAKL